MQSRPSRCLFWLTVLVAGAAAGCRRSPQPEVVVYTALDREFSEPVFQDFQRATGIRVLAKYDVE